MSICRTVNGLWNSLLGVCLYLLTFRAASHIEGSLNWALLEFQSIFLQKHRISWKMEGEGGEWAISFPKILSSPIKQTGLEEGIKKPNFSKTHRDFLKFWEINNFWSDAEVVLVHCSTSPLEIYQLNQQVCSQFLLICLQSIMQYSAHSPSILWDSPVESCSFF